MSLLAGALLVAQSGPVRAQPTTAANKQSDAAEPDVTELMRTAMAQYKKNDLEGARQALQQAWNLRQHAAIAASLADVELKLGRYREAAEHLGFYLSHLPPGKESARQEAEQQLAECKKHLGAVHVKVEPGRAMVLVDGTALGEGPIEELLLDPGAHTLQAEASDRLSTKQTLSIAAGEHQETTLVVAPSPEAAPATAAAPAQPARERPVSHATAIDEGNTAKFWTVVAGGALAAAGVAVGATYTLKSNHDATRADGLLRKIQSESDPTLVARGGECAITPAPTECAEFTSARSDSHQERNVAIGSFIAGGTFALATVGALVFWPESKPASAAGRVTLSPSGNWRAPAIILQGTF